MRLVCAGVVRVKSVSQVLLRLIGRDLNSLRRRLQPDNRVIGIVFAIINRAGVGAFVLAVKLRVSIGGSGVLLLIMFIQEEQGGGAGQQDDFLLAGQAGLGRRRGGRAARR